MPHNNWTVHTRQNTTNKGLPQKIYANFIVNTITFLYNQGVQEDKKYLLQLYKALHPEDCDVTEDEISDVTIKHVLVDADYNDLGFSVGDRLMVLVESQST